MRQSAFHAATNLRRARLFGPFPSEMSLVVTASSAMHQTLHRHHRAYGVTTLWASCQCHPSFLLCKPWTSWGWCAPTRELQSSKGKTTFPITYIFGQYPQKKKTKLTQSEMPPFAMNSKASRNHHPNGVQTVTITLTGGAPSLSSKKSKVFSFLYVQLRRTANTKAVARCV